MSRSATPALRIAATVAAVRFAFSLIAPAAVGAWVTTPALIVAMSGTALTSPVATTSSRVPASIGGGGGPASCAIAGAVSASTAGAIIAKFRH